MILARQYGFVGPIGSGLPRGKLTSWRRYIDSEAARQTHACWWCLAVGLLLQVVMAGAMWGTFRIIARVTHRPEYGHLLPAAIMAGVLSAIGLGIALITKPESRADVASSMLSEAIGQGAAQGLIGVSAGIGIGALMVVSLYGCYAIVESVGRLRVRYKLRNVNRFDAARILSEVCASPMGVGVERLALHDQSPMSLRESVALLLLDGWVDLCDRGQTLMQRSPAVRRFANRHPLAAVFEPMAA